MNLSSFQANGKSADFATTEHQFDTFCKLVLKNEARDYFKELRVKRSHEVLFSELKQDAWSILSAVDEYPSDRKCFIVDGFNVMIENDLLANALAALPEQSRNIILMAHFLKMTDKEIAETLKMVRSTVQYQRKSLFSKIRKHMEGADNGKE